MGNKFFGVDNIWAEGYYQAIKKASNAGLYNTGGFIPNYNYPKVDKIIYNLKGKTTIMYWKDGDKTVVKCTEGEDFTKEGGVSACFMKKIFVNRNEFKRIVDSGFEQMIKDK